MRAFSLPISPLLISRLSLPAFSSGPSHIRPRLSQVVWPHSCVEVIDGHAKRLSASADAIANFGLETFHVKDS